MSFINMDHFKVPANLISLGAIDFGLIVDAAVIVMENIMRHLEEGETNVEDGIIRATSEVQRADDLLHRHHHREPYSRPCSSCHRRGWGGIIFKPMAFTTGFALLASIVLALTDFVPAVTSFCSFSRAAAALAEIYRGNPARLQTPAAQAAEEARPGIPGRLYRPGRHAVQLALSRHRVSCTCWRKQPRGATSRCPADQLISTTRHPSRATLRAFFHEQPEVKTVSGTDRAPRHGTRIPPVCSIQEYVLYFKPLATGPKAPPSKQVVERAGQHLEIASGHRVQLLAVHPGPA
ncbi:efflux RND transporter permease subunit [Cupriavidus basilensis]